MIVTDRKTIEFLAKRIVAEDYVVLDTETTGLDVWAASEVCGIGLCFPSDESTYYIPYRHKHFDEHMPLLAGMEPVNNADINDVLLLIDALNNAKMIVGHNIKFDIAALYKDGLRITDQILADTHNAARLYFRNESQQLSLDACTQALLKKDTNTWKKKFQAYLKDRKIKDYSRAEIPVIAEYCELDCLHTKLIYDILLEKIEENQQSLVWEQEKKVLKIAHGMERSGLQIDLGYINASIKEVERVKALILNDINEQCGKNNVDPWSNKQLTEVFAKLDIKPLSYTEKGTPQWTEDTLSRIEAPLAGDILNWRKLDKLTNTFFEPYAKYSDSIVHCNFNNSGTITGRFTCSNPNLQQVQSNEEWRIPQAPDFDIQVRKMFVPPEGYNAYYMDFSQMEMLVYAAYLRDPQLTEELNKGKTDFHSLTAQMIFKVGEDHPDFKKFRKASKSISLGLIYGMGEASLASKIGVSIEEARDFRTRYFTAFPNAPLFFDQVKRTITTRGYVFNRFGRRYYLPQEKSYVAINYLIQGTSADIIKQAMIRIDEKLKGTKSRMCLQMHDEFGFYFHEDEEHLVPIVHKEMEHQLLEIFLPASISKAAPNWSQKVSICRNCYQEEIEGHEC